MKDAFVSLKNHMKNIVKIYERDMKNILTNYVTMIIVLALIILPSLYSWFNIKASWDPYGNTKGLSVAVVNLDEGAEFRNVKINVGSDVVKKLADNQSIGWKFVSESEAESGIKYGKYYASLTIPKDFSQKLISIVTEDTPKRPQLIYAVNEKRNAIAPKITQKGATNIQEEITKTFIETSSDTILSYLNQFGIELESLKPKLKTLVDIITDIDDKVPELGRDIDNTYAESLVLQKYMQNLQNGIPTISDALNRTLDVTKTGNEYLGKSESSFKSISPAIKTDLELVKNANDINLALLNGIKDFKQSDSGELREVLVTVRDRYSDEVKKIEPILSLLSSVNNLLNNKVIGNLINKLSNIKDELIKEQNFINSIITTIDKGNEVLPESIDSAIEGANKISNLINDSISNFDGQTVPAIESAVKNFRGISGDVVKIMQNAQNNIPLISSLLQGANTGLDSKIKSLKELKDRLPQIQQEIHSNSEKIRSLNDDEKINEIVRLLKRDAKTESQFLSDPIELKQNRVYPIPNYGSAMAPFYTTLALWVGAFILLALLTVEVKNFEDGVKLTAREQFLGRYLTFVTIAIMQALVTILGNLYLLKTYAVSPGILTVFGIYTSVVFVMIIYTLVSVLGNIGKALAMIALVLQVSASGGTFPIELMPHFFQAINPLLPFTYAIGGMREAVGGILPEALIKNSLVLGIYFGSAIIFGLCLKEKANKITKSFVKQFKDSGLAGE